MDVNDTNTTNFERKNIFDLSVPCEWAHYKVYKNAWLVVIGPSKPKLWLIELEKITTKPICLDVNQWYEHDKVWGEKHFWFKCAMWMSSLQSIQKCLTCCNWTFQTKVMAIWTWKKSQPSPFAWMLIYDSNTTNIEGEKTFDLRAPCEWAHYKLHKNAWFVVIGPSKLKLWLIELEQITTKPICMDVNQWYEHD